MNKIVMLQQLRQLRVVRRLTLPASQQPWHADWCASSPKRPRAARTSDTVLPRADRCQPSARLQPASPSSSDSTSTPRIPSG